MKSQKKIEPDNHLAVRSGYVAWTIIMKLKVYSLNSWNDVTIWKIFKIKWTIFWKTGEKWRKILLKSQIEIKTFKLIQNNHYL